MYHDPNFRASSPPALPHRTGGGEGHSASAISPTTHSARALAWHLKSHGVSNVAVLGLMSDTGARAPILNVIAALQTAGVRVRAHDPALTPDRAPDLLCSDVASATDEADVVIVTRTDRAAIAAAHGVLNRGGAVIDATGVFA